MAKMEIVRYKIIDKGSLFASVTIKIPSWGDIVFEGLTVFKKDSRRWLSFPSKKDDEGKYWPYIRFENRENKEKFDLAVLKILDDKIAQGGAEESPPDMPDIF